MLHKLTMSSSEARRRVFVPKPTGRMVPCPGDAHTNAYIDHCGLCAPRWGLVAELEPVTPSTIENALARGFLVRMTDLDESAEARFLRSHAWYSVTVRTRTYTVNFLAIGRPEALRK